MKFKIWYNDKSKYSGKKTGKKKEKDNCLQKAHGSYIQAMRIFLMHLTSRAGYSNFTDRLKLCHSPKTKIFE